MYGGEGGREEREGGRGQGKGGVDVLVFLLTFLRANLHIFLPLFLGRGSNFTFRHHK